MMAKSCPLIGLVSSFILLLSLLSRVSFVRVDSNTYRVGIVYSEGGCQLVCLVFFCAIQRAEQPRDSEGYEAYINRRVSGYLIPTNGMHTFIFLSEDCLSVSSFQMYPTRESHPISTEWFLKELKSMDLSYRKLYVEEPLGLVLDIMKELIRYRCLLIFLHCVHLLFQDMACIHCISATRSREHCMCNESHAISSYITHEQDGNLPESLPVELPEHNLYDIGTYLHRDVVQTLFRFSQHLGKFEGYLKYLYDGTKDNFRPKVFMNNAKNLNNVIEIGRRLAASKERANMSLTLVCTF